MSAIAIKERPILFSGPMVRAILDGRKTQTRRVVAASNSTVLGYSGKSLWHHLHFDYEQDGKRTFVDGPNDTMFGCGPNCQYLHVPAWHPDDAHDPASYRVRPIYEPGEHLWVRETFAITTQAVSDDPGYVYRATDPAWGEMEGFKWKPSIFMPRAASRIILEITEVRVERLNTISESDARAEGPPQCEVSGGNPLGYQNYRGRFRTIWECINGVGSWSLNPWVWAITFKRVVE